MPQPIAWTDEMDEFLSNNAKDMTAKELTAGLDALCGMELCVETVRYHCKTLGAKPKSAGRHIWTLDEENFLRDNMGKMVTREIAAKLGLPVDAVYYKRDKLKRHLKRRTPWMESMVKTVGDTGNTVYGIALELWEAGRRVEVNENRRGELAVFST